MQLANFIILLLVQKKRFLMSLSYRLGEDSACSFATCHKEESGNHCMKISCPSCSCLSLPPNFFNKNTSHPLIYYFRVVNKPFSLSHSDSFPKSDRRLRSPETFKKVNFLEMTWDPPIYDTAINKICWQWWRSIMKYFP